MDTQFTSIIVQDQFVPKTGALDLQIQVKATMNLSAEDARRKVNRFAHREISYLLRGDTPSLAVGDGVTWRVPLLLTFPSHGSVGSVGFIDVDVASGEMQITTELITEIQNRARHLAARTSSHAAPTG